MADAHSNPTGSARRTPPSAPYRLALLILRGMEASADPRTLHTWAREAGVSVTTLREACCAVGLKANATKDLMRVLRAMRLSYRSQWPPEMFLEVHDSRTLRKLFGKSGNLAQGAVASNTWIAKVLESQRFVPPTHPLVSVLSEVVSSSGES